MYEHILKAGFGLAKKVVKDAAIEVIKERAGDIAEFFTGDRTDQEQFAIDLRNELSARAEKAVIEWQNAMKEKAFEGMLAMSPEKRQELFEQHAKFQTAVDQHDLKEMSPEERIKFYSQKAEEVYGRPND